jgi:hypothetical protein
MRGEQIQQGGRLRRVFFAHARHLLKISRLAHVKRATLAQLVLGAAGHIRAQARLFA